MSLNPIDKINLNQEYLNDFLIESKEHLQSIESNINLIKQNTDDTEALYTVYRDFHSIKGLAGLVSQSLIHKLAHQSEGMLDKCRSKELEISENLIKYILISTDLIKQICNNLDLNENQEFINKSFEHMHNFDIFNY